MAPTSRSTKIIGLATEIIEIVAKIWPRQESAISKEIGGRAEFALDGPDELSDIRFKRRDESFINSTDG